MFKSLKHPEHPKLVKHNVNGCANKGGKSVISHEMEEYSLILISYIWLWFNDLFGHVLSLNKA